MQKSSVFLAMELTVVLLIIGGCEAPLNLESVSQEKIKPVLRFDQFQAAAKTDDTTILVGSYGAVLVSNDQGKSWHRKELDGKPPLIDLAVCPDHSFVALDFKGKVWLSQDNGDNWGARKIDTEEVPQALACDPNGTIWVVGSFSHIYSSPDLGESWNQISFDEDFMFTTIQFINDQEVVITGEFGTVMFATDSGKTWLRGEPIPNEFYPQAAYFHDLDTGWVVGLNGKIFYTHDRGQSWQEEATETNAPLYKITSQNDQLFAVGERGVVLYRDESNHWRRYDYPSPIQSYLRVVLPVNFHDLLLIAGGAGAMSLIRSPVASQAVVKN